jgi:hypothetical protein
MADADMEHKDARLSMNLELYSITRNNETKTNLKIWPPIVVSRKLEFLQRKQEGKTIEGEKFSR